MTRIRIIDDSAARDMVSDPAAFERALEAHGRELAKVRPPKAKENDDAAAKSTPPNEEGNP